MIRQTARVAPIWAARAVLFLALGCADSHRGGAPLALSFQVDSTRPHFGAAIVTPLDASDLASLGRARLTSSAWQKILVVRAGDTTALPMLGRYIVAGDTLRFDPTFPPVRGTTYIARFSGTGLNAALQREASATTRIATWTRQRASGAPTTTVEAVYPTIDSVPMNMLRMYVQFSAPMTVGDSAETHVRLLDEQGKVVDKAFLVAAGGQELWDRDHRRLTIFFDPGRIKRDLKPHEALGLPLRTGHAYSLVVDSALHDARGLTLAHGFVKRFRVGPIDRDMPMTSLWRVAAPAAGTREPVTIELPEPLDHALLSRMLTVKGQTDMVVAGTASTANSDRRWTFTPARPWDGSDYFIEVDTELEDLAGNNLRRPFDVMPGDKPAGGENAAVTRIRFTPKR